MLHRRQFLGGLFGAPFLSQNTTVPSAGGPLVVTSKTNPRVREEITATAWEILNEGGSAMDATEKATNRSGGVSFLGPKTINSNLC